MFTFDVSPDGAEPFRVTATSRDVAHWERTGKGRSIAQIESNARMSDLEEIAYLGSVRRGRYAGSLADFREQCDVLPVDPNADEDRDTDPTRPGR